MALPSRTRSARLLVLMLVSASLVTITVDYRQGPHGPLAAAGDAALAAISPLQDAVSKVTKPIGNYVSTLVRLPSIRAENEALRARVAELEAQVATSADLAARVSQLEALLGLREELGALRTVNSALHHLSRTPAAPAGPPPALGEHTEAVLREYLGLTAAEVATLRAEGAVG